MSAIYQIRTYTPAGALTNVITDYLRLAYTKGVNEPGMLSFLLNGEHISISDLEIDAQVEVWRADPDRAVDWYCDFYGFWRGEERTQTQDGVNLYTAICPGQMALLDRAIVAYPANTADRTAFTTEKAETVAKNLVKYNATSSGTTGDGRARNVSLTGISIQADGATGNTIDFLCAWRNLLSAVQEVAQIGGGDFALVKTGAQAWEFRWYAGQLGTDRSATITFATQYGNMANPKLVRSSMEERTIAIVGGQGEESARSVVVRTGANYATNPAEVFVDARSYTATAGLEAEGDRELDAMKRRDALTFDVLQVPSTLYGVHYDLGDLVTAVYQDVTATKMVRRVSVSLAEDGREQIRVEMADV